MYLYYLLGWKGYMAKNPSAMPVSVSATRGNWRLAGCWFCFSVSFIQREMNPSTTSLFSMNGESFVLPHHDNDHKRKFISDENTYLLALDGDTDFHPKAVILLVDRWQFSLHLLKSAPIPYGETHSTTEPQSVFLWATSIRSNNSHQFLQFSAPCLKISWHIHMEWLSEDTSVFAATGRGSPQRMCWLMWS